MSTSYHHTFEDIKTTTSLNGNFIYRANRMLSGILSEYCVYGNNNEVRFNDSGLLVWDRIAQLKRDGKNISQIASALERDLSKAPSASQTTLETLPDPVSNRGEVPVSSIELIIKTLTDQFAKTDESRTSEIAALKIHRDELQKKILALPDGRAPEQITVELALKEEQRKELDKLNALRLKRQELIREYEKQTGWGKGSRREAIMKRINEIDK